MSDRFSDEGAVVTQNRDGTWTVLSDGENEAAGLPPATSYPLQSAGLQWLEAQRAKRAAKRDADSGNVDYPADEPID